MSSLPDSVTAWASAIAAVFGVVGLVQSRPGLASLGVGLTAGFVALGAYTKWQQGRLQSARVTVEKRSIDALNLANLQRRVNRTLTVQSAERTVTIEGSDLRVVAAYAGFCRAESETAMEFSINTDSNIPFAQLECFGYDLLADPKRRHAIRPILLGADGNAKKIAVPFARPLAAQEPFAMLLSCALPGCIKSGVEYYTAALSFDQECISHASVRLIFLGERPDWVRVYEAGPGQRVRLIRDLRPVREEQNRWEYLDVAKGVPGQSAKIYLFSRPSDGKERNT